MWIRDRNGVLWDTSSKHNLRMNLLANGGTIEPAAAPRVVVVTPKPAPVPAPEPETAPEPEPKPKPVRKRAPRKPRAPRKATS